MKFKGVVAQAEAIDVSCVELSVVEIGFQGVGIENFDALLRSVENVA